MAAISPCESELKESAWQNGASMYVAGQYEGQERGNKRCMGMRELILSAVGPARNIDDQGFHITAGSLCLSINAIFRR
jgi:hypothetical protein